MFKIGDIYSSSSLISQWPLITSTTSLEQEKYVRYPIKKIVSQNISSFFTNLTILLLNILSKIMYTSIIYNTI